MAEPLSFSMPPIDVMAPLRRVNALLLELLDGFSPSDWQRPTVHKNRDVKDLVAHMLDGSMRRLACNRDGYSEPPPAIRSYQDLVDYIQKINREWMTATRRLSPKMLIDLTRIYDAELADFFAGVDPGADACFSVAWAGEDRSAAWFDVARDYTEKWHHQQQLRDATGRPPLYERDLLAPVIETFACGWPHALRDLASPVGTRLTVELTGALKLVKTLIRTPDGWRFSPATGEPGTLVSLDTDLAWRLWTKGVAAETARAKIKVVGDESVAEALCRFVAILA